MIQLSGVTKHYGDHKAVDALSVLIRESETFVLLGTSGCGKTTTLRMINRLITADEGSIEINGAPIDSTPPEQLRRTIGYVMQQNGLFPHYTVVENIAVVPTLLGWPKDQIRKRALSLMEQLHLPANSFAHRYPHQLSGGQQQRVGVARALAGNAPILLMDEPFGALDPVTRSLIRKEFMELEEISKKTIVLVTHDIPEAFEMADRICLMNKGRAEQTGTPSELLFSPASAFVRSFFDADRELLELNIVTMRDLWPHLGEPVSSSDLPDSIRQFPAATSCWQILNWLTGEQAAASVSYQHDIKMVSRANLLQALGDYKTSQYG
ncbi:ABC transporter ATP-binding protein [Filimonas effusa]|uniref:ATP-binding cassette domain-containing protein n=1 Tax=Filimonas effusa TaxID=2508721 RepID=A0A4Q1DA65_9BACT|nr:ATP-binding cassette domain-containing protein [Filimonas effusa]RXK86130.1 ATP-binding cassette domain-containing protein [Filimonas effusa]